MESSASTSADISELPKAYESSIPKKFEVIQSYFELTLYVPPEREQLVRMYRGAAVKHNAAILPYISGKDVACDSGFDLFVPEEQEVFPVSHDTSTAGPKKKAVMINHHVKCCMRKIPGFTPVVAKAMENSSTLLQPTPTIPGRLVGYYLYPRSSMATKTPLRLANSVGIIDAGYRGEIQAAVDVLSQDGFQLPSGLRIVQLCPPSLDSPIYVKVITDESLLGKTTRGAGGFGSTGRVGAKLDGATGGDAGEGDE